MDMTSRKRLNYEDYTVALVCAMSFEMSAIRYMLDQEHVRLPTKQGDSNIYVLGELSGHNVAISCLPGNQGKGSAATVAANMTRTFPSIKYRLLTGIGGGVPSDVNDIRLGDVVVSMPNGQNSGVVQYDQGKDTESDFKLKGFLWPLPTILRSAVMTMQSDHMVMKNRITEFISAMLQKGPRLTVYQRPSPDLDILFEPDYAHDPKEATCEKCDKSKIIPRRPREADLPEIHYGLIASGDRVIRSAIRKRAISQDIGNILCFEMEAAGLMSEFPGIIIRGISDYADSHKNDIWQPYAAATAAACAKELLSYIYPGDLLAIPPPLPDRTEQM
ncbi:hypothetical protein Asppvi_006007 [Aspergillus pseudoviridinutans]|uniref:Nucleoside phosphorylase domain-containing protein n=1 Tax=Aspergillus pseudoviridinutans TaxID=1517512 RepID=A0A9P3BFS1_9EURO|nr:uncharacterized protein Asppvi_006007 [Aspergillus pseudoviridinutans]GIJ87104.1 hypothetical protein Asppvi_006007 [Aspergillus pseudoviridinutans]